MLLAFVLFTVQAYSQSNYYHPADWLTEQQELAGVKGDVKGIETKIYAPDDNDAIGELLQMDYYEWDESDRIYRWEYQDFKLDIQFIQMYTYFDVDDYRINKREHFNAAGNLVESTVYDYDLTHEDMVKRIHITEYDEDNPETIYREFMIDIELDDAGVRRKDVIYRPDGTVRTEVEVNYNDIGLISSKKRFRDNGDWVWTDSIEYTPLLRKHRMLKIRPDKLNGGQKEMATQFVYDDALQLTALRVGETEMQYAYEYDARGNWVVKKTFRLFDGAQQLYTITERDIRYEEE
ncbi:MAG: hypothetical protein KTR13_02055 [Saprospiraceae bacterium]|nr:hypothetical protein [Saprospiraceae bacterium]